MFLCKITLQNMEKCKNLMVTCNSQLEMRFVVLHFLYVSVSTYNSVHSCIFNRNGILLYVLFFTCCQHFISSLVSYDTLFPPLAEPPLMTAQ